jgi:hypothetical protein
MDIKIIKVGESFYIQYKHIFNLVTSYVTETLHGMYGDVVCARAFYSKESAEEYIKTQLFNI